MAAARLALLLALQLQDCEDVSTLASGIVDPTFQYDAYPDIDPDPSLISENHGYFQSSASLVYIALTSV